MLKHKEQLHFKFELQNQIESWLNPIFMGWLMSRVTELGKKVNAGLL